MILSALPAAPTKRFAISKRNLPDAFKSKNIPASIREDFAKSGGLFGNKVPMLVISHPNPPSHYFDIGIVINGHSFGSLSWLLRRKYAGE